jgi:hypothetical protein
MRATDRSAGKTSLLTRESTLQRAQKDYLNRIFVFPRRLGRRSILNLTIQQGEIVFFV